MANFIIIVVLLVILGASCAYVIKQKKRGVKCMGCPAGGQCSHSGSGNCTCGNGRKK